MANAHQLKVRQTQPAAQKFLQASLCCDHRSSWWDGSALVLAILGPILQATDDDSSQKAVLQYVLVGLIAAAHWKRNGWKEKGRKLRNEFEYYVYDIRKPYSCDLKEGTVLIWQESFKKRQLKLPKYLRQETSLWFFEKIKHVPEHYLDQIKAAQHESLDFGRASRRLWALTITLVCIGIVAGYGAIERDQLFRSSAKTLGTVAVVAIVSQIGRIAWSSFSHARDRSKLDALVMRHEPTADNPTGSTESLAILQERISAARKGRVVVPQVIYWAVKWWKEGRKGAQTTEPNST